jgi:hypothetical protein
LSPRTFQILFTQSSSQPPFKHSNIWSAKMIYWKRFKIMQVSLTYT